MKEVPLKKSIEGVFKVRPKGGETKPDQTTRVVREILSTEAAKRTANTARLRAMRLAQEARLAEGAPAAPVSKSNAKR